MKLCHVLKGRIDEAIGATTGYLGRFPALQSVYNWGYKGYYTGGDETPEVELDQESLNLIKDKTDDIAFLIRVKNVDFTESCKNYKDDDIDGLKIRIAVE